MSLNLPLRFKEDIQGRDTNLFPVIVIGNTTDRDHSAGTGGQYVDYANNIHISTNDVGLQITSPGIADEVALENNQITYFEPILLNVPSLKESIDIQKRKYKISSINISISNLPYNVRRF